MFKLILVLVIFCFAFNFFDAKEIKVGKDLYIKTIMETDAKVNIVKRTAIIHIGPHKTGSTHLQEFFMKNAKVLRTMNYLQPFNSIKEAHILADALKVGRYDDPIILKLKEIIIRRKYNVLLSSEGLSVMGSMRAVQKLKDIFKSYNCIIVYVFREAITRILSHYSHMFGSDLHKELPPFKEFLTNELKINTTTYHQGLQVILLKRFTTIFGAENIIILDYYGIISQQKDIADVFLQS
jgi:hypothetical protein